MSLRLRKRIKILPGVYINLSKSGVSTSVGARGASVTVGHGKTRTNLGIPGTGISYNTVESNQPKKIEEQTEKSLSFFGLLGYGFLALFILMFVYAIFNPHG